jgi:hypothetical protein
MHFTQLIVSPASFSKARCPTLTLTISCQPSNLSTGYRVKRKPNKNFHNLQLTYAAFKFRETVLRLLLHLHHIKCPIHTPICNIVFAPDDTNFHTSKPHIFLIQAKYNRAAL